MRTNMEKTMVGKQFFVFAISFFLLLSKLDWVVQGFLNDHHSKKLGWLAQGFLNKYDPKKLGWIAQGF